MTRLLRSSIPSGLPRLLCVILGAAMFASACNGAASNGDPVADVAAAGGVTPAAARPAQPKAAVADDRDITIPSGTALNLSLVTAIASDTSDVEDAVTATLTRAVTVGGREVVPVGATVSGHVTSAEDAGRVKGRAQLSVRFNTLTTGGERYDMRTAAISRMAAATKGEDAAKIGIGAGAGAIVGGLLGGKDGAAKGAAVGGGAGTGVVLATKGREMRLPAGADLTTTLTAPLTVRLK